MAINTGIQNEIEIERNLDARKFEALNPNLRAFVNDVFSPTVQEYLSFPLKWVAFPLLTTVLAYTLCLPFIAKSKNKKIEELVRTVNEEMREKGLDIMYVTIKKPN